MVPKTVSAHRNRSTLLAVVEESIVLLQVRKHNYKWQPSCQWSLTPWHSSCQWGSSQSLLTDFFFFNFLCGSRLLHAGPSLCHVDLSLRCTDSLVMACGAQSTQASVVATHGFSCPQHCGILVPWPEMKPSEPALQGRFSTTGPPGKSHLFF